MSWRKAGALVARIIPAAADAAASRQGFPALAAVLRQHAQHPCRAELCARGFAAAAVQQQAEPAMAAEADAPAGAAAAAGGGAAAAAPEQPPMFSVVGRVADHYTVPPKKVFAVVQVGGTQYKVTPDDVIVTERLRGVDVNDTLHLPRVLLLGSQEETIIGRPYIPEAYVTAAVEEQFLDGKVLIFHKRRRKNSRRLRGHRQPLTTLRILDINGLEEAQAAAESI